MYETKRSQRISVSDTKTWVGYDRLERWKRRIQKDSEVSNANNTDRVYWNEGNREVHQYSKAKLKVPQSLTKMVVVPDNKTTKQTIPNDSQWFKVQDRWFYMIQDPRPAIQYDSQRFNTIQDPRPAILYDSNDSIRFKSHAQTFYTIQQTVIFQLLQTDVGRCPKID